MRRQQFLARLLAAVAFAALPGLAFALEEQSLLTTAGTLHVVRTGRAVDLGVDDASIPARSNLIEWTSRAQDGTLSMAIIPNTVSLNEKHGLQLAFDDQTQTLLVLWIDEGGYWQVRVGALHDGVWTNSGLIPSQGISRAYNPRMAITHQAVTHLDEQDQPVARTSSILSIIWWEEALVGQARLANLFLDEANFDTASLATSDLPALVGSGGDVSYDGIPAGAYMYPGLQADGLSGAVMASFADLHDQKHKVVNIRFPADQGKPSDPADVNWKRRHIPIVGVATEGPVARMIPTLADTREGVRTAIGSGYRPTLSWREGDTLKFSRLDGAEWAPVRSITVDDAMTYDRALALVTSMGERN